MIFIFVDDAQLFEGREGGKCKDITVCLCVWLLSVYQCLGGCLMPASLSVCLWGGYVGHVSQREEKAESRRNESRDEKKKKETSERMRMR